MSPVAQRRAIAEACGYRYAQMGIWVHPKGYELFGTQDAVLPRYLDDLNAMHEAEKILFPKHEAKWAMLMSEVCGHSWRIIYTASAAQRAEAFLKTLGLWVEAESPEYKPKTKQ
jgi:hypothetical protein